MIGGLFLIGMICVPTAIALGAARARRHLWAAAVLGFVALLSVAASGGWIFIVTLSAGFACG